MSSANELFTLRELSSRDKRGEVVCCRLQLPLSRLIVSPLQDGGLAGVVVCKYVCDGSTLRKRGMSDVGYHACLAMTRGFATRSSPVTTGGGGSRKREARRQSAAFHQSRQATF